MTKQELAALGVLIHEYVRTKNSKDMKEWYTTDRGIATGQLERFMKWLTARATNEPDTTITVDSPPADLPVIQVDEETHVAALRARTASEPSAAIENLDRLLQDLGRLGCTVTFCSLGRDRVGAHIERPGVLSVRQMQFGSTAAESLIKAAEVAELLGLIAALPHTPAEPKAGCAHERRNTWRDNFGDSYDECLDCGAKL